ncbi:HAD family hydrolase [Rahnella selenatireducens]|uniref:HAD family hydrolase n=1 Tax=Rahnella selenatireducens TaxID=3389797 RepID=UPI00396951C0
MKLALFDLDETLISGDCSSLWSAYMVAKGWVADEQAFLQQDAALMQQYAVGKMDMQEYMRCTLVPLIDRRESDVAAMVANYIQDVIAPRIYTQARDCLAAHRAQGDRTVIISASGEHLVRPIARFLGVDETLAIGVEILDGRFTGATQGTMTYREGKVSRLLHLINQDETLLQEARFYSDSHNDLPLLNRVGYPVAVNPDAILLRHAQQEGWPIYAWH